MIPRSAFQPPGQPGGSGGHPSGAAPPKGPGKESARRYRYRCCGKTARARDALPVGDEAAFQTTIQNLSKYFLYYKTSASSDNTTLILNGDKRDARDNYHTILYITNAPLILNCNYSYNGLVTETHTQYRDEIRYRIETRYKTETMYGHWYIN